MSNRYIKISPLSYFFFSLVFTASECPKDKDKDLPKPNTCTDEQKVPVRDKNDSSGISTVTGSSVGNNSSSSPINNSSGISSVTGSSVGNNSSPSQIYANTLKRDLKILLDLHTKALDRFLSALTVELSTIEKELKEIGGDFLYPALSELFKQQEEKLKEKKCKIEKSKKYLEELNTELVEVKKRYELDKLTVIPDDIEKYNNGKYQNMKLAALGYQIYQLLHQLANLEGVDQEMGFFRIYDQVLQLLDEVQNL